MSKYEMDMTSGNLFKKIIVYTIPIIITGVLQLLYNAADVAIVGNFADESIREAALAAVTSTGSLTYLVISLFMGLSVGASVSYAKSIGKGDTERANKVVHTSVIVSSVSSIILTVVGIVFAKDFLRLMDSPENVIDLATQYVQIYFGGIFFNLLYNFASSIVRANGDSKRPLYILTVAGIINVLLNLLFVTVFHMNAAGVALATVISQAFSSICIMYILFEETGPLNFSFSKLKVDKSVLKEMILIGLPSGIQMALFSISNVIVQKTVNGFSNQMVGVDPAIPVAGNGAASTLEGFVHTAMNAVYQSAINFTGQNYGAKKENNLKKVLIYSLIIVTTIGVVLGVSFYLLGPYLLRIFTDSPEAITYALNRMKYVCLLYFVCGVMDVLVGFLRGIGYSMVPMIVSLLGVCAFRIIWIFTVYEAYPTPDNLYISYPISWTITSVTLIILILVLFQKIKKKMHMKDEIAEVIR